MDSRTGGQLNQMISKESEQEYICRLLEEVERLKQICEDQKNKLEQYRQKLSQKPRRQAGLRHAYLRFHLHRPVL